MPKILISKSMRQIDLCLEHNNKIKIFITNMFLKINKMKLIKIKVTHPF